MDFDFPPNESYYACYQLRDVVNPSRIMSKALEIHCIDMTKWRKLPTINIVNDDLHRWLAYFDQSSPPELIAEVAAMDEAIKAADERRAHVTMDEESRDLYMRRQMALMDEIAYSRGADAFRREGIEIGREEGLLIGREEGQEAERLNIARNALAKGLSMEVIQDITGLDRETLERLGN